MLYKITDSVLFSRKFDLLQKKIDSFIFFTIFCCRQKEIKYYYSLLLSHLYTDVETNNKEYLNFAIHLPSQIPKYPFISLFYNSLYFTNIEYYSDCRDLWNFINLFIKQ